MFHLSMPMVRYLKRSSLEMMSKVLTSGDSGTRTQPEYSIAICIVNVSLLALYICG